MMADWMHRNNGQDAHKSFWPQHCIEISGWMNKIDLVTAKKTLHEMDIPPDPTVIASTNIMIHTMGVYN